MEENISRANPPSEASCKVYVGKIPDGLRDEELARALALCGNLRAWKRVLDPRTGDARRFGFATFERASEAMACAKAVDGLDASGGGEAMTCSANAATREAARAEMDGGVDEASAVRLREAVRRAVRRALEGHGVAEEGEISVEDEEAAAAAASARASERSSSLEASASGVALERARRASDDGSSLERRREADRKGTRSRERSRERGDSRERDGGRRGGGGNLGGSGPATRFGRGSRHEFEAAERIERLCREREKACDDIANAVSRERARREKSRNDLRLERRDALKRDLASDDDGDGSVTPPLWERSSRERERRKRFRERELEDDARDRAAEAEEMNRRGEDEDKDEDRDGDGDGNDARATARPTVVLRGFVEPLAATQTTRDLSREKPSGQPTSFGLAPARKTRESALTAGLRDGSRVGHAGNPPSDVFEDADDNGRSKNPTTRRKASHVDVAALVASVPTSRSDVFAHKIDWSVYDGARIADLAERWISKKLIDLLGEAEPALERFVLDRLSERPAPEALERALEPALDVEAPAFVHGLWRVLIFEIAREKLETSH